MASGSRLGILFVGLCNLLLRFLSTQGHYQSMHAGLEFPETPGDIMEDVKRHGLKSEASSLLSMRLLPHLLRLLLHLRDLFLRGVDLASVCFDLFPPSNKSAYVNSSKDSRLECRLVNEVTYSSFTIARQFTFPMTLPLFLLIQLVFFVGFDFSIDAFAFFV